MDEQAGGKRSAWMSHVKRTMKANKGKSLMQVLKMAKKTYKKMRGGADSSMEKTADMDMKPMDSSNMDTETPAPTTGGRRRTRKGKKSRRGRKSRRGGMYDY
jgi:hypothetical protein